MSRESIRQAFKTAVESVFSGQVFTSRLNDLRETTEYVTIYIESGEISPNFSGFETTSDINIKYAKQNASDEELDQTMEDMITAILSSSAVQREAGNIVFSRFEYDDESDDIVSITYTATIIY